jgi:hypothetical protein
MVVEENAEARSLGAKLNDLHAPVFDNGQTPMSCQLCGFAMYYQGDAGLTHFPLLGQFGAVMAMFEQLERPSTPPQ